MGREDELAQRIAIINRTGSRLIDLVKVEFPRTIDRDAPAYRVALHGLVARTTGTMEAILHLAELRREADLAVLLRSLYDHTTVLAWLAGDPDANYPLWRAEDARQRVGGRLAAEQKCGASISGSPSLRLLGVPATAARRSLRDGGPCLWRGARPSVSRV